MRAMPDRKPEEVRAGHIGLLLLFITLKGGYMEFRIINHVKTKTYYPIQNAYHLNLILKSLINRETDTVFIATMNDRKYLYNLHMFHVTGLESFKSELSKHFTVGVYDQAAYISIAYNVSPKSEKLDKEYKKAVQKVIDERSIDYVPVWTALHYVDGKYTELHQRIEDE